MPGLSPSYDDLCWDWNGERGTGHINCYSGNPVIVPPPKQVAFGESFAEKMMIPYGQPDNSGLSDQTKAQLALAKLPPNYRVPMVRETMEIVPLAFTPQRNLPLFSSVGGLPIKQNPQISRLPIYGDNLDLPTLPQPKNPSRPYIEASI